MSSTDPKLFQPDSNNVVLPARRSPDDGQTTTTTAASTSMMDIDPPQEGGDASTTTMDRVPASPRGSISSWQSTYEEEEEEEEEDVEEEEEEDIHPLGGGGGRPQSSLGLSHTRSLSDRQSTSHENSVIMSINPKMSSDDPRFHAAYRLFKASVKRSSDQFGPFLPDDDGSPFLAHRLSRMWNDLSTEQRGQWLSRAGADPSSPSTLNIAAGTGAGESSGGGASVGAARLLHYSPSPTATGSFPRSKMSPITKGDEYNTGTSAGMSMGGAGMSSYGSPEVRSPASVYYLDDADLPPAGSGAGGSGPSMIRSRSQSPSPYYNPTTTSAVLSGLGSSHVPRPPNAWILFRSTMSKKRRPDGIIYSPPEISVLWKGLSQQERDLWYERAKAAKQQHEAANPGYKYQPNRKKQRKLTDGPLTTASPSATTSSNATAAST
ncbi:hypothetical protein FRC17_005116, partial [Serendipita sp. 399]